SASGVSTNSGTYGRNDPVTLSFLADLGCVDALPNEDAAWKAIRSYVHSRATELGAESPRARDRLRDHKEFFSDLPTDPAHDIVANAIIPLRVVQAMRTASDGKEQDIPSYREFFETTLHDQLSFSSIPDSRFDPAELAFCLEGLLLAQPAAVARTLAERVLEVLTKAQEESAS